MRRASFPALLAVAAALAAPALAAASGALTLAFSATVDPGVSLPSWAAAVTGDFAVTIRADHGKLLR